MRMPADFTLAQLRTFVRVAEGGSFTHAAGDVSRTQPTVSRQVRALEQAVEAPLFLRVGRTAVLTDAGHRMLGYARRLLALVDEARAAVSSTGDARARRLRIGAGGLASQYLLPGLLEAFRARHPAVQLVVATHHPETITAQTVRGELDVALVTRPVRAQGLVVRDVGDDEMVAIAGPGHPWARRAGRRLPVDAFDGEPFILYDRGTGTSRRILGAFARRGVRLTVAMEVGYVEAMKEMVRIGLGVTLVPGWVVAREVTAGQVTALRLAGARPAGPGFVRRWALVFARGAAAGGPLDPFVSLCRERLPALLAGPFPPGGRA
jgi:DNA-binding transcriptional LysR family regulator